MKVKFFDTKIVAVVSAIVLLIVSVNFYNPVETNALSQVTYLRYDYTNPNSAPYEYTLSLPDTSFNSIIEPYYISPPNDMVRDYDTAVVRLSSGGTGFIINDHVIVTAGHCIYDYENDNFSNITVDIVGSDNKVLKTVSPHYAHVTKKFADITSYDGDQGEQYDYGLIYVDEDLSDYGTFGMGICLNSYVENNGRVTVSGFPQQYPEGYEDNNYGLRFKASGNITGIDGRTIEYNADMTNGDSGGPVYVNESYIDSKGNFSYDYNTVIAINVAQSSSANYGVRVNFDILYFCYRNVNLTA